MKWVWNQINSKPNRWFKSISKILWLGMWRNTNAMGRQEMELTHKIIFTENIAIYLLNTFKYGNVCDIHLWKMWTNQSPATSYAYIVSLSRHGNELRSQAFQEFRCNSIFNIYSSTEFVTNCQHLFGSQKIVSMSNSENKHTFGKTIVVCCSENAKYILTHVTIIFHLIKSIFLFQAFHIGIPSITQQRKLMRIANLLC